MKAQLKKTAFVLFASCLFFAVHAQINLLSNDITFRSYNNANHGTTHYGDLDLEGGAAGTGWGWLGAEVIRCYNWMDVYGSLHVYGTKNFIHPHPSDSTKLIQYIAIESGEALTLVRGTSKTVNGQVTITLPEHFSLVTSSTAPITVLITPKKVPALLYTKDENRKQIVVAMKESDFIEFRDVEFAFQVTGVRDGFEDEEVIVDIAGKSGQEKISEKRAVYNEKVQSIAKKINQEKKKSQIVKKD